MVNFIFVEVLETENGGEEIIRIFLISIMEKHELRG